MMIESAFAVPIAMIIVPMTLCVTIMWFNLLIDEIKDGWKAYKNFTKSKVSFCFETVIAVYIFIFLILVNFFVLDCFLFPLFK